MKFGSLFSGIGGLDLGLERAGMECRWQVEINEFCQKILRKHWPNIKLISSVEAFLVNQSPKQDLEETISQVMNDGSGQNFSGSFAYYDHESSSLKTRQVSLFEDSPLSFVDLPKSGMMLSGQLYELQSLDSPIGENDYSLWPTPKASDSLRMRFKPETLSKTYMKSINNPGEFSPNIGEVIQGEFSCFQNSELTDWIMGFPRSWTDLKHSETP